MRAPASARTVVVGAVLALAACAPPSQPDQGVSEPPSTAAAPVTPTEQVTPSAPVTAETSPSPPTTEIRYRAENSARDAGTATAGFAEQLHAILTDPRGWARAGFRFVADPAGPYRVVLAEGEEVDNLCRPYDTGGRYSCQNGPVVALNADRWRGATPQWPADLDGYRTMLVNHEVGHLLHLHHPRPQCPGPGLPAPVMAQQSTELGECLPNPWPLEWEIALAAERREPLAPPADHAVDDHRPAPPPARR